MLACGNVSFHPILVGERVCHSVGALANRSSCNADISKDDALENHISCYAEGDLGAEQPAFRGGTLLESQWLCNQTRPEA